MLLEWNQTQSQAVDAENLKQSISGVQDLTPIWNSTPSQISDLMPLIKNPPNFGTFDVLYAVWAPGSSRLSIEHPTATRYLRPSIQPKEDTGRI